MIILAYIFYFVAASASPLQRRWLAKNKSEGGKEQIHFSFCVFGALVIGSLFFPFFSPFFISGNVRHLILLALSCGIFGAVTFVTTYLVQRHMEAGVSTVLSNIYTPVTIILASFFLHESLNRNQIIGTTLLLVAIFIVSKQHRISKFNFDKNFWLMMFSGLTLGILLVSERALQKMTGFSAGTMISWWAQFILLGLASLWARSRHSYSKKDVLITGTLRFLQALSWVVLVYIVGNLSLVSSVTTFKVVIMFILAAVFLHEREDLPRKVLGSIIAVIGLLMMA